MGGGTALVPNLLNNKNINILLLYKMAYMKAEYSYMGSANKSIGIHVHFGITNCIIIIHFLL